MKKKIAALLQDSKLIGNSAFEGFQKAYRLSKSKHQKAKADKTKAKLAFQNLVADGGKKDQDVLMATRTAFQQAKTMLHFHRLALDLAEFRLTRWLENWVHEVSEPQEWVLNNPEKKVKKAKKEVKIEVEPAAPQTVPKKKTAKAAPKTASGSEGLEDA